MAPHPIRLVVTDDGRRSRLTVFFRLPLAIVHLLWVFLWTVVAFLAALLNWVWTLIAGRSPQGLHDFLAAYVRMVTHLYAFLYLIANPFPDFNGTAGSYTVDVRTGRPERQNRWTVAFRIVLAVPALLLATVLGGQLPQGGGDSTGNGSGAELGLGVLAVAVLGWFASLVTGRMPRGLRDLGAYMLGYCAQVWAYVLLVTGRYPNSDPVPLLDSVESPHHPVRLVLHDDRRRSRLTVLFRLPLTFPHFIWMAGWGLVAVLAAVANWLATLVTGRSPAAFQRFLAAFVRYVVHVYAFLYVVGNPFPGFTGRPGSYPVEVAIDRSERQNRWITGFRGLLAVPAVVVASVYANILAVAAVLGWFAALVTGRVPQGLRNIGAVSLRYQAQMWAYLLVLTDSYPYAGPTDAAIGTRPVPPAPELPPSSAEPEPEPVPA